jgi:hemerythrin-like domain-containing protein
MREETPRQRVPDQSDMENAMTTRQVGKKQAASNTATKPGDEKPVNAIQLLKSDHAEVKELFDRFEKIGENPSLADKEDIVRNFCLKLSVHATIEEEIFYPAAREVPTTDALLNEAEVEHGTAKELIAALEGMEIEDEMFDANFAVLSEYIKHHVKEEEGELFPKIQKSALDLNKLGLKMLERKEQLTAELLAA